MRDDGKLVVRGRIHGHAVGVRLLARGLTSSGDGPRSPVSDGVFEGVLELHRDLYRFGRLPLPFGEYGVAAEVWLADGAARIEIPIRVAGAMAADLPVPVLNEIHEGHVVRGPESQLMVQLVRPIGPAEGLYQQNLLRTSHRPAAESAACPADAVLLRGAGDRPRALRARRTASARLRPPRLLGRPRPQRASARRWHPRHMEQPGVVRRTGPREVLHRQHVPTGLPREARGTGHHPDLPRLPLQADGALALGFNSVLPGADRLLRQADRTVGLRRVASALRHWAAGSGVRIRGRDARDRLPAQRRAPVARGGRHPGARPGQSLGIATGQTAVLYAPTFRDYLSARRQQRVDD